MFYSQEDLHAIAAAAYAKKHLERLRTGEGGRE
jgi:hypothetical protein